MPPLEHDPGDTPAPLWDRPGEGDRVRPVVTRWIAQCTGCCRHRRLIVALYGVEPLCWDCAALVDDESTAGALLAE